MFDLQKVRGWFLDGQIDQKTSRLFAIPTATTLLIGAFALLSALVGAVAVERGTRLREANLYASQVEDEGGTILRRVRIERSGGEDPALRASVDRARQAMDRLGAELDRAGVAGNEFSSLEQRLAFLDRAVGPEGRANDNVAFKALDLQDKARKVRRAIDERSTALSGRYFPAIGAMVTVDILLMVLAVASFLVARRMVRDLIVRPVVSARDGLKALTAGQQDFELIGADREDEIGEVARALDALKTYSRQFAELHEQSREAARQREAQRAEHAEMLRQLAQRFETTVGGVVGGVASASSQLQATAATMAAAAEQSSRQTAEVTGNLGEASQGVTAAASACDEFALSISEISRQAMSSAELARQASQTAASADQTIAALNQSAVEVGEIVELIASIAQRTNMLALNATIEAARGGEAGRGFAVVAAEVKDLALRTGQATERVAQQVRAMQGSTGAGIEALRRIADQIGELEATSIAIATAVDQQSVAGQDLARSIDMAARNTAEVSTNIVQVRETALATGVAASQVLTSSKELEHQAEVLRSQVDQFLGQVRAA